MRQRALGALARRRGEVGAWSCGTELTGSLGAAFRGLGGVAGRQEPRDRCASAGLLFANWVTGIEPSSRDVKARNEARCVFITAGPSTKLFAWGGGYIFHIGRLLRVLCDVGRTGANGFQARRGRQQLAAEFRGVSLNVQDSQTKLSHAGTIVFSDKQRISRFHARCRVPPLHSERQVFGNAGVCFWPMPLVS
jgi:hypothetical protein